MHFLSSTLMVVLHNYIYHITINFDDSLHVCSAVLAAFVRLLV